MSHPVLGNKIATIQHFYVLGFVMDEYVLQYYWKKRLSKLNVKYVLERKFKTTHRYGINFYTMNNNANIPNNWRTCLETWINYNQQHMEEMESFFRRSIIDADLVSLSRIDCYYRLTE